MLCLNTGRTQEGCPQEKGGTQEEVNDAHVRRPLVPTNHCLSSQHKIFVHDTVNMLPAILVQYSAVAMR